MEEIKDIRIMLFLIKLDIKRVNPWIWKNLSLILENRRKQLFKTNDPRKKESVKIAKIPGTISKIGRA